MSLVILAHCASRRGWFGLATQGQHALRLLRAKPEKIIVDVLGSQSEFPEQPVHLRTEGSVKLIDCGGILCAMRRFGLLRRS